VVVNENAVEGGDPYKIAHLMNVTLSSDHRVVDGAVAAEWGQHFKKFIENPELMLL
jgi:pyruvate dehydrogenase E2 component (dihydrolipoamide acetyltransferase)